MSGPLRWGILGTAGIARKAMIPGLLAAPGCRIDAIASRDGARARAMADDFAIPRSHDSYDALIADPGIDAVYIPVPNHLHVPLTCAALAAGKHVLCEKPLSLTPDGAAEVAAAQAASGRLVMEAFMVRHHPQWLRARAIVRDGGIGRLCAVQAAFCYANADPANVRNQADIGGGGLYDVGCYALEAGRWFFGTEPERVAALADIDPAFGTDRLTSGLAAFPGGGQLAFTVSTQAVLTQSLMLIGTTGRITLDIPYNAPRDHAARLVIDDGRDLAGGGARTEQIAAADQYAAQAETFARLVATGTPADFAAEMAQITAAAAALSATARAMRSGGWETP
ncbi:Gfo/Idh/MocA family protein [Frigidibacter sp. MR17.24]|uniref:Gfo/Idh/MocA family protein n=1 Tax=Frigidibacter sp. MR17.24 TaxID=3127345 RepID=UPI003012AAAD